MASKSIDIIISTILKRTGIDAAKSALNSLTTSTKKFASAVARNLTNIKSAFEMVASGARTFLSVMSKGMEFERMTTQFKSLTGSMELARAHMKDLQDLGRTPPFSLEQFAAASQAMMKMTGGMAGFKDEMEIVGDMAAATGNDIATVGRAFGLAYQVIRDGQDFGRAGQQLYSLGIMTKKQVAEFAELSKAGTDNAAVWEKLQEVFGRYKGAMAATEQTTKGVVEAIQGEATVAMTEFSAAISESAKPALEGLLGYLKRINEDGTIEDWADRSAGALSSLLEIVSETADGISGLGTAVNWAWEKLGVSDAFHGVKSIFKGLGAGLGAVSEGGSFGDAYNEASVEEMSKGYYLGKATRAGFFGEQEANKANSLVDNMAETAEEKRARRAEEKAKKRAEEKAKAEAEAKRRVEEDMARAQDETDRRKAEEKAKADAEAAKKAEAEYLKAVEAERKAREKIEADLHKQRVDNLNAEANIAKANMDATERTISAAQTEFDKAFAMYRSEDKGAAQIAEERDYAADYKQLQKDANRYGGKWRIDELSSLIAAGDTKGQQAKLEEWRKSKSFTPEVESMVRAAAADQTRTTAEDELRKISANTQNLANKLDELLSMKG